jgi:hypothetical protein
LFFFRAFFHRPKTPVTALAVTWCIIFLIFSLSLCILLSLVFLCAFYYCCFLSLTTTTTLALFLFLFKVTDVWHHFRLVSYNKPDKHDYNTIVVSPPPLVCHYLRIFFVILNMSVRISFVIPLFNRKLQHTIVTYKAKEKRRLATYSHIGLPVRDSLTRESWLLYFFPLYTLIIAVTPLRAWQNKFLIFFSLRGKVIDICVSDCSNKWEI